MTFLIPQNKLNSSEKKELLKKHNKLEEDFKWILEHKEELRERFGNSYIAVDNKTVRYTAETMKALIGQINAHDEHVSDFAIEYIGNQTINVLF